MVPHPQPWKQVLLKELERDSQARPPAKTFALSKPESGSRHTGALMCWLPFESWLSPISWPWSFREQTPPPLYYWAQLGTLWSCTSPDSLLARVPWVSARLAQGPGPGNEALAGGFVFCENQTHNRAQAAKQSLLGRLAGLLPQVPSGTTGSTSCHPGWHRRPSGQGLGPALSSQPDPLLPGLNWNKNEKESLSSV